MDIDPRNRILSDLDLDPNIFPRLQSRIRTMPGDLALQIKFAECK